jgi:hypothetical protein
MKLLARSTIYFLLSLPIFTSVIAMSTGTKQIPDSSILSSVSDPEIASSQSRIDDLNHKANFWNRWYLRLLFVSVVVGGGTVACQYLAITRTREMSLEENKLLHLKDIKAASDSRDKDIRIGQLGKETEGLHKENIGTSKQLVAAQRSLEDEHIARLRIEEKVAWRRIEGEQQTSMTSHLTSFAGQFAGISYNLNDLEASTFALDIATALHSAHWRISEPQVILALREGPMPFGTNPPLDTGVIVISTPDAQANKAAEALVNELTERGFDAKRDPRPDTKRNGASVVYIQVEHRPEGAQGEAKLRLRNN